MLRFSVRIERNPMTPEQERLWQMLKELTTLFEARGLRYYVAGGTTLGAMRHKGFIPWDDDIDIMMPREDWKRFLEIAQTDLPEGRLLSCLELDTDYPNSFARYVDTTSTAIHNNQLLGGSAEGFIIDIFVLDPVPDDREAYYKHRETLMLYSELANPLGYSFEISEDNDRLLRYEKRIKAEGRAQVLKELEAELCRYEVDECDYQVMRWGGAPRVFPKDMLEPSRWGEFEGLRVRMPGRTVDYLVRHYGDEWMYVPPKGQQVTHDDVIATLDVDYLTFQADYLPFINAARTKRAVLNRRKYHLTHNDDLRQSWDLKASVAAGFSACTVSRRMEKLLNSGVTIGDMSFEDLEWVFADFYTHQTSAALAGREDYMGIYRYHHPIYIDLGDDMLEIALRQLVRTNRIGKAWRILEIREYAKGPLPENLESVRSVICELRKPMSLYDAGDREGAINASLANVAAYPDVFTSRVFCCYLLEKMGRFDLLEACVDVGLRLFPQSGEFMKFAADCERNKYSECKNPGVCATSALALRNRYEEALQNTTNHFVCSDASRAIEELACDAGDSEPCSNETALSGKSPIESRQCVPMASPVPRWNEITRVVASLLAELEQTCKTNDIPCCLGPHSCRLVELQATNTPAVLTADFLVPAGRLDDLAKAIERAGREDRAVDYWGSNNNYLSYRLDYVDKKTTYLQVNEGTNRMAHGIKVTVLPLRKKQSGCTARHAEFLERGWEINGYRLTTRINAKRIMSAAGVLFFKTVRGANASRRILDTLEATYAGQGPLLEIKKPDGTGYKVDAHWFENLEPVNFAGVMLKAPVCRGDFLARCFGANWKQDSLPTTFKGDGVYIDDDVPYEELVEALRQNGAPIEKLFTLMRKIRLGMLPLTLDLRHRDRAMRSARLSLDRLLLDKKLSARQNEIQGLRQSQAYEQLEEIFGEYERLARQYLRHGLGLCPRKEYLDTLCDILVHRGEKDVANRLRSLVPQEHYKQLGFHEETGVR